jgi:hypothetical protein
LLSGAELGSVFGKKKKTVEGMSNVYWGLQAHGMLFYG